MNDASFLSRIHRYLRAARGHHIDTPHDNEIDSRKTNKEYPRMPKISLSTGELVMSLGDAIRKRRSSREMTLHASPTKKKIGVLFHHALKEQEDGRRPYPSGGALYPIETYLIARGIADIPDGIHHYHPRAHALEYLWPVSRNKSLFVPGAAWADSASTIIILTALWKRNYKKYNNFGYLLGVLEAGHIGQNIFLVATALNLSSCPVAGFNDEEVTKILNLEREIEQPVLAIVIN